MSLRRTLFLLPAFTFAASLGAGCSDPMDPDPPAPDPIEYYNSELSASLGANGNQARCSTCHSNDGSVAGRSGYSMMDIAYKDSWKGGDATTLLDAINACVTGWMGGTALTADDEGYIMLETYFQGISNPANSTPNAITPEVLDDEAAYEAAYGGGDAAAGEAVYNNSCAVCHDVALVVGTSPALSKVGLAAFTVGRIAQKVRTSGPPPSGLNDAADLTPGPMPFFEMPELSTQDLANLIAYLKN